MTILIKELSVRVEVTGPAAAPKPSAPLSPQLAQRLLRQALQSQRRRQRW
ncbi:hypothetical protein LQR31_02320 [Chromobacterium vaccinii]|nr:hypothetical protein [Chromobacterium vaccinii]MCD4483307.1 hypothetical protein [Chromobacterium vaccinii]